MIDSVCFLALLVVIAMVIYGFTVRAIWAHGYYIAVASAVVGAIVLLIGLAQQAIAARDAATWRDMALWQLRAARQKVSGSTAEDSGLDGHDLDPDSRHYYEHLVGAMLESVQHPDEPATRP